jgi:hypothetical protein
MIAGQFGVDGSGEFMVGAVNRENAVQFGVRCAGQRSAAVELGGRKMPSGYFEVSRISLSNAGIARTISTLARSWH